jgi:hypothetical protein
VAASFRRHDDQRSVEARPEALGQQVVGLPAGLAPCLRACVGEPEAHTQRRHRKGDERRDGDQQRRPRTPLHEAGPTPPAMSGHPVRPCGVPADAALDSPAEDGEQCREQRHGGDHGHQDGQGHAERDALQRAQPEGQQAEQGDDDGRAREQHRSAGRVQGRAGRCLSLGPVEQLGAVAGEDQQRVVDSHPEADQHHQRRCAGHRVAAGRPLSRSTNRWLSGRVGRSDG